MGYPTLEGLAIVGSLLTIAGMIMFAVAVFRPESSAITTARQPAE
jgi:hypothetical protein